MKKIASFLIIVFLSNFLLSAMAQSNINNSGSIFFDEIELLVQNGKEVNEKSVRVEFFTDSLIINSKNGKLTKTFRYADIKNAEYSYSKNPRWKTGLGLGAASILFPPLIFVALPLGFTKHRRHWVTIQTADDYAVLKLSKSNRKIFIPTFETKSGVTVEGVGENK
jgi:hypothetical protein